ncbi:lanosterol 14-alpha-demethylase [Lophium mytilinum]|uniref:Lanosterol 14-alpha-demethylase n=1 Tax=Lophium mytilinum TaxID=390894 RepID=A0A6A6R3K0_9PEZI|nr:lanosterol 14-alpha-demethylase [Lophium mytilinum]
MATRNGSTMKRGLNSGEVAIDNKKPRRSQRISSQSHDFDTNLQAQQLPSPFTHQESTATEDFKDGTATPPSQRPSQFGNRITTRSPQAPGLSSPPSDTQPFSQVMRPPRTLAYEVDDEEGEGVWGYLVPLDSKSGGTLVLRRRSACPKPSAKTGRKTGRQRVGRETWGQQEKDYETEKAKGVSSEGYLIGRHPECDRVLNSPVVSNRHCLIFSETKGGDTVAVLEDLSGNGTFVNEAIVGRNKRRELVEGDEVTILDEARFVFRYPHSRIANRFRQQYTIQEQLGKGHFATVYLCVEKNSGMRYAVKKFEKRTGPGEKSRVDGLQQEIGVLMGVSHPTLLCLKDTYDEEDGVYLVLELAAEGELFNWIIMKQKLTEAEARKVFIQLFQGVKYLHERNIVHRDIKPENILLTDRELHVKLADFGLAKIIGEESFTTTLCGTPSYVAPEILENSSHRRYTRAVDVWSLGVVLYICLCGFPPFSDELYSAENPYTLSQQIKMGRFDYPSPYWDSVGDPALDLIDRMLTVDVDKRITIEECLEHPWTTLREINPNDSTDGLTGAIAQLDFSKRKPQRERTLLSKINDIRVTRVIEAPEGLNAVKVFEKNEAIPPRKTNGAKAGSVKENTPAANRAPDEFVQMGGKGDQLLFSRDDSGSKLASWARDTRREGFRKERLVTGDWRWSSGSANVATYQRISAVRTLLLLLSVASAMGLLATITGPLGDFAADSSLFVLVAAAFASFLVLAIVLNVLQQLLLRNPNEPPVVFHWVPVIGSTISYGIDPYKFFFANRAKYGDVFTFILLGKKTTVCLGTKGNNFILNGKIRDVNAEEVYSPLTTPVFGSDVVYDCPNSKLMEQKKFVKFGLTQEALRSYVPLISREVMDFIKRSPAFKGKKGTANAPIAMAELTIFTASRSLQGEEVRNKFDSSFADVYHDLDMGFTPINFMLPWFPLPHNRKRDIAHTKMIATYSEIIRNRRSGNAKRDSEDMIWHLMDCKYKDGTAVPDHEIAGIMIALLMAGQHSSSSTVAWILLRLASRPDITEELLQEQKQVLGADLPPLTHDNLARLPLHAQVVKETLRIHAPIHSILRKVKSPMPVEGTPYTIPTSHVLLSSPGVTSTSAEYFPNPSSWEPHRWDSLKNYEDDDSEEKIDYGWGVVSKGTNSPYLPFGAGRHRCIGEQFAYLQLQTILATIVREFKVRNLDGSKEVIGTDYTVSL